MDQNKTKKISISLAAIILISAVLTGGYFILKTKTGSASISQQLNYLVGKIKTSDTQKEADSDNDGLRDWEEKIYGADPDNPDSDQDGYLDGEEIAGGYDPTKKAPDDELASADPTKPRPLPKNLTKALSLKLTQAIADGTIRSLDKDGKPLSQETISQDEGLGSAIQEATAQSLDDFVLPSIANSEIKISDKTGPGEAANYLSQVKNILGEMPSRDKPEMETFAEAIETGNFATLQKNQKRYQEHYQALRQISVPSDLASFHKGILGVFWVTNNIYASVINIHQDPLKATIAIMKYGQTTEQTKQIIIELISQIKNYKNG